jgi:tungstate transport system substrate-binding protein
MNINKFLIGLTLIPFIFSCSSKVESKVLRLATTTSTYDSGLLDDILPDFEDKFNARVDVIAVGTGQAIALGESGDVDVILVHAREKEDEFITEGHGTVRLDVMYNDFILVGPNDDPADIKYTNGAADAFTAIALSQSIFASRGDDSGTHYKELSIWKTSGITIDPYNEWYKSLGQGMGDTLLFANETNAYTLVDRGTYLSMKDNLPNLTILFGGSSINSNPDATLFNPYSVIPVNPNKRGINTHLVEAFTDWITSHEVQTMIKKLCNEKAGQQLFYPNSEVWKNE